MEEAKVKAQFMAQYLGQQVHEMPYDEPRTLVLYVPHPHWREEQFSIVDLIIRDCNADHLLLRTVEQLTDEEKQIIAERMQIYQEDVIDWINGDCGHDDFENLHTWLPCYDMLKALGIILPFTYLNGDKKPVTLQTSELVERGWAKIKSD